MSADLENLLSYLDLETLDSHRFVGGSPPKPRRIFGGQVLGQSLIAAARTVQEARLPHSMHAYFLRPGNPELPITYEVDPIRDGRSFTTRRVVALQQDKAIFSTSVSFHVEEAGLSHQIDMPDVPPPEALQSDEAYWAELARRYPGDFEHPVPRPVERFPIKRRNFDDPQPVDPYQHFWFRANGRVQDDPILHCALLAFMSDHTLLGAALLPHPYTGHSKDLMAASLDHAIWFHRPFRADEFLLYTQDSPSAAGGRGYSRGLFYTREGVLVASAVQESLMRVREPR